MASADVMTASIPVPTGDNVERRHRHHHCHHGPRSTSPPYNRQHGHRCRHGAASAPEDEGLPSSGVMSLRHNHGHGPHGRGFWRARSMGVTGNPETQTPLPEPHPDSDDGGLPPSESAGNQHPGHHRHHTGRGRGFMYHGHHHHGHHGFVPAGTVDGVAKQVTSNDPELASGSEAPGPSPSMVRVERFRPSHAGSSRHGLWSSELKGRHGWKCHPTVPAPETPSKEPESMESTESIEETKEALDALDLADTAPKPEHPTED